VHLVGIYTLEQLLNLFKTEEVCITCCKIQSMLCDTFQLIWYLRSVQSRDEEKSGFSHILFRITIRDAGRGHSVKIDNSSIERVEEFKYLQTTLTDQNAIQEEIMSRLKLGNACYHSVQNLLSSSLLFKNLKIKIYRTIILPVVLYGWETWSLTLR
jgi:hypothetical protein